MIHTKPWGGRVSPRSCPVLPVRESVIPVSPTERERELIALIAEGLQNKMIAHRLSISPNTVRAHIGNIMRKYGLHNRTQIAMTLTAIIDNKPIGTLCSDKTAIELSNIDEAHPEGWLLSAP
ncbi:MULTISPECIES: LuxR C-terminal-related transcriptional regulator [unclassified Beijerinckia]|uniref:response regulator transcription factor n=1 Tax=unclassified Beijerinckia TaxID=2638183 RepID=UPI0008983B7C|nr:MULTISPECIES: LuxR C-terminal-related transcriptional regulator [unclassified Beijerinckia]MDH7797537.1 DNA-binding CsgD family transcriptional regulator [Beijerinckia sp. GAS462]SEC89601.1 regulatory protein, luxR family [Beijerinckia sp. 28-YEA-48]